jgi:hypothetical protein
MTQLNEIFGRQDSQGNIGLFFIESGEHVTRLDSDGIYPVDADVSTKYEHPGGIIITVGDASRLGIEIEFKDRG